MTQRIDLYQNIRKKWPIPQVAIEVTLTKTEIYANVMQIIEIYAQTMQRTDIYAKVTHLKSETDS